MYSIWPNVGKPPLELMEQQSFHYHLIVITLYFLQENFSCCLKYGTTERSSKYCCLNAGITWIPKWSPHNANHNVLQSFTPDGYSYNRRQQDALLLNFILVKNSTCFGQTYCLGHHQESFTATGICHTAILIIGKITSVYTCTLSLNCQTCCM